MNIYFTGTKMKLNKGPINEASGKNEDIHAERKKYSPMRKSRIMFRGTLKSKTKI